MIIATSVQVSQSPEYVSCRNFDGVRTTWDTTMECIQPYMASSVEYVILDEGGQEEARLVMNRRKIDQISGFSENWNGYGAQPLSSRLLEMIKQIIVQLKIQPELFPTANGSVQLEWEKDNGAYLEVEIFSDGRAQVFQVDSDGHETEAIMEPRSENINKIVDAFYVGAI